MALASVSLPGLEAQDSLALPISAASASAAFPHSGWSSRTGLSSATGTSEPLHMLFPLTGASFRTSYLAVSYVPFMSQHRMSLPPGSPLDLLPMGRPLVALIMLQLILYVVITFMPVCPFQLEAPQGTDYVCLSHPTPWHLALYLVYSRYLNYWGPGLCKAVRQEAPVGQGGKLWGQGPGANMGQILPLLKDVKGLSSLLTAAWMIETEPEAKALHR